MQGFPLQAEPAVDVAASRAFTFEGYAADILDAVSYCIDGEILLSSQPDQVLISGALCKQYSAEARDALRSRTPGRVSVGSSLAYAPDSNASAEAAIA